MIDHEKVIAELKTGKYNLSWIERQLNIPPNTLYQAIGGNRNIPAKYLEDIKKELKIS